MAPIWDMLDQAKADVVVQAHEHHYERFAPMTATGATVCRRRACALLWWALAGPTFTVLRACARAVRRQVQAYGVMRLYPAMLAKPAGAL